TVTISSPSDGAIVKGTIAISGSASDTDGIVSIVQIRIDNGSWLTVNGTTSWLYIWDTTKVLDGFHTISARSFDGTDYSSIVSISVNVKNEVEAKPPAKPFEIPWLYIIIPVIVIVVLAAAGIGIRRRKRKVAPPPQPPSQQSL
ncbi:MAG: Ig-like domain-containing protein, partial [Candidatus Thermoplasmatota archaeon]|nr:Ig-like domain-containing protein [Candidatus Thermoplasmatota archaeon]